MKEIVVISGKGGTGKTSILASFAALAGNPVLADCDVDAADLHLVVHPTVKRSEEFSGGKLARILAEQCTGCGECEALCRFGAVRRKDANDIAPHPVFEIDPIACEGCGVCAWFCKHEAIEFKDAVNGKWFLSDTRFGPMVHAKLGIAEENSGKLVTLVRNQAKKIAEANGHRYILVDGSPGIGCPVIASITGADLVVIVTEPTVSGEHDLDRVAKLAEHFGIPATVCINKCDLNPEMTAQIIEKSKARGIKIVGEIRYDKAVTEAQIMKTTVMEYTDGPIAGEIKNAWHNVIAAVQLEGVEA